MCVSRCSVLVCHQGEVQKDPVHVSPVHPRKQGNAPTKNLFSQLQTSFLERMAHRTKDPQWAMSPPQAAGVARAGAAIAGL